MKMSTGKRALITTVSVLAAFAIGFSAVAAFVNQGDVNRLQRQLTVQSQSYTRQVRQLRSEVTSLSAQVSAINIPTDPLSAYNDICNQQETNNNTGVTQTYYFPCTNNAETIPQPGN
jgi:cell division protein FtsB